MATFFVCAAERRHKSLHVFSLVILALLVFLALPKAGLAGLLSDHFGVTPALALTDPFTNTYDGRTHYHYDYSSLVPTLNAGTTDYVVGDWYGRWSKTNFNYSTISGQYPSGSEPYDVEAYYFNDDPQNLYIAVLTSFPPPPGIYESRVGGSPLVVSGDLALGFGLNGPYSATDSFNYDYGVNINNEVRPASGNATSGGTGIGQGFYRTLNSDWYTGSPSYATAANGEASNFDPSFATFGGTYLGDAIVDYYRYDFDGGLLENGAATYVIEVTIPRSLFPMSLAVGTTVGISWVEGCRNDGNNTQGILRYPSDDLPTIDTFAVPEPATFVLLGVGTVGLVLARRRRRIR